MAPDALRTMAPDALRTMAPEELRAAAVALFGDHKGALADLARALGVARQNLWQMTVARRPIPAGLARDLRHLLAIQQSERALAEAERLIAQHGQPEEIVLTAQPGQEEVLRLVAEALRARGIPVRLD